MRLRCFLGCVLVFVSPVLSLANDEEEQARAAVAVAVAKQKSITYAPVQRVPEVTQQRPFAGSGRSTTSPMVVTDARTPTAIISPLQNKGLGFNAGSDQFVVPTYTLVPPAARLGITRQGCSTSG